MNTLEFDVIVAGIVGFLIGAILVGIISYSGRGKKNAEVGKLQAEYDKYREQVNAHFAKTADAIDGLTKSYQQVFDHLSDGAQNLMDKNALQAQLEKRQGKAVTLAYLVDQEDVTAEKVSEIKSSTVVAEAQKKMADSKLEPEAPVAAKDKADVVANANKVKVAETATVQDKPKVEAQPEEKTNVQKAAEKAGLKPAKSIVDNAEHETAINSVKKHIKDDKGSKA